MFNISIEFPLALLLLPLPFFIKPKSLNHVTINVPSIDRLSKFTITASNNTLAKIIFYISWVCLIVAASKPVIIEDKINYNNQSHEILLAVDLSRSMEPALPQVKKTVKNFILNRKSDKVGLVVFAENAYLAVPLTNDNISVAKMLDGLFPGMAGESTAIWDAIAVSSISLKQNVEHGRVLVLLTDGDDNASRITQTKALDLAVKENIKIYTIGLGENYTASVLKNISEVTGGIMQHASNAEDLEKIYHDVDRLEKSTNEIKDLLIAKNLYRYFLSVSVVGFISLIIFYNRRYV